jgi:hypothetical protein
MDMYTQFICAGLLAAPILIGFVFYLLGRNLNVEVADPPPDWNRRVQQRNERDTICAENKSRRAQAENTRGDEYPTYRTGQK